jgi:hypothetical protein
LDVIPCKLVGEIFIKEHDFKKFTNEMALLWIFFFFLLSTYLILRWPCHEKIIILSTYLMKGIFYLFKAHFKKIFLFMFMDKNCKFWFLILDSWKSWSTKEKKRPKSLESSVL